MQEGAATACPQREVHASLAVLGVFSADAHSPLRAALRESWMAPAAIREAAALHGIDVRFVLRGLGASPPVVEEEAEFRDIVFVNASAAAGRKTGPLLTLFLWWRHALNCWPQVKLIGKADDDVWVRLAATATHLSALTQQLHGGSLYWGAMELFHWSMSDHLPALPFAYGFGFRKHPVPCRRVTRPASATASGIRRLEDRVVGPFQCGLPRAPIQRSKTRECH
ncbi:hypothetical protein AB1Y20_012564 [Prymnesium parvum]|uniref:Hexosyltransferase n=1 Tax=Prymnesium parvum TaxID=97485 RepID=A0AB34IKN2_PRYPA